MVPSRNTNVTLSEERGVDANAGQQNLVSKNKFSKTGFYWKNLVKRGSISFVESGLPEFLSSLNPVL